MTTCELVMDFGYSCQTIQVATEDGYVIEVDRVRAVGKGNISVPLENGGRRNSVILIPGIMDDSGSVGVASSLVLLSTRPQYNNKVDILIGYGPVANLSHAKYPVSWLMKMNDIVSLILDASGNGGYLHPPDATKHVLQAICETFKGQLCSSYLIIMSLMSGKQLNKCELVMDFGYSCETSQAITEDGYVLEVDRVRAVTDQNASTASGKETYVGNPSFLHPAFRASRASGS
ncbi:hypothetical protein MTO96_051843 [Rhipicephalus appendiculatus]